MNRLKTIVAVLLGVLVLALPGAAAADQGDSLARTTYAQIEGTGSTWSELIVQQWIADVDANGMKVVYTGGGSSKGRKDFSQNSTDFAISEIPYQGTDEQGNADTSSRPYAYLPIVAGGTAFTYQLKIGGQLVRNLRLSGDPLSKIFTSEDEVMDVIARAIELFRTEGKPGERFANTVQRLGFDYVDAQLTK